MLISLSENFSSSDHIFLNHFSEINVVDFDIMCRKSVVEETWWEHHVVSIEPEFDSVLSVENVLISCFFKSASTQNHATCPEVTEEMIFKLFSAILVHTCFIATISLAQ